MRSVSAHVGPVEMLTVGRPCAWTRSTPACAALTCASAAFRSGRRDFGFGDQRRHFALEAGIRQRRRRLHQRQCLPGREAHDVGQRPQRIARLALGPDAVERRLRQRGLRQQAVGRRRDADVVARFGRVETFARRPLGLAGRHDGGFRRLREIEGLQSGKEQRLDRGILRRGGGGEQLPGVFACRRARAGIENQPGQRQCRAGRVVVALFGPQPAGAQPAIEIRQPGRLRDADLRRLKACCSPHLARLRIVAQRQVDRVDRRQRRRRQLAGARAHRRCAPPIAATAAAVSRPRSRTDRSSPPRGPAGRGTARQRTAGSNGFVMGR